MIYKILLICVYIYIYIYIYIYMRCAFVGLDNKLFVTLQCASYGCFSLSMMDLCVLMKSDTPWCKHLLTTQG